MTDLITYPVKQLAKLVRTRAVSPVELITAFLDQIERCNPQLNAVVTLAPDAIDRAKEAERLVMSGDSLAPLHGIPVTIKDTIETAGLRTTSGSRVRENFVPPADAPAVARLKAAGAIILAKTNAAEMAMDYTADNLVFGRTNNPFNVELTPGGSSGGEAVAIATCMSPAGLGSDLAGSIRIPAHFCGIAGLKPGTGRISGEGQFPASSGPYSLGAAIGPMAKYTEDLSLIFRALIQSSASSPDVRGMRVAWYANDEVANVTAETRGAVEAAAGALKDAGLICEERRPPHVERGHELWLKLFSRASVVQLRKVYTGHEQSAGGFVRWRLKTADEVSPPTLDDYIANWMERDLLREELRLWMESTPLILAPVGATPAFEHDTLKIQVNEQTMSVFRAFSYSQAFNVFDLPSAVIPAAMSETGSPIGVQVVGRPGEEEAVLATAAIIERALGGWRRPRLF
ncbi:MAG: amidase [Pyrinomonadaceae bacterium]